MAAQGLEQSFEPVPPTAEVSAWDRHCRIKFAKQMEKAAGANA